MTALATHLSEFLFRHLPKDRRASQHTVSSYTATFRLLNNYIKHRLGTEACLAEIEQITPQTVLDFLDFLEQERGSAIRTRNARLVAIKSFFRYLEYKAPACLDQCRQVRAIPEKRADEKLIDWLSGEEMDVLLAAPDMETPSGLRDRAMLLLAYSAGLRVSELVSLKLDDFDQPGFDRVHVMGKGRRERVLPLWKSASEAIVAWLDVRPPVSNEYLFVNSRGRPMTRHGFAHRLAVHTRTAQQRMPSIARKNVTPHSLRHSCAVLTLEETDNIALVSLWLGHASAESTAVYLRVNPKKAFERVAGQLPPEVRKGSFKGVRNQLEQILKHLPCP